MVVLLLMSLVFIVVGGLTLAQAFGLGQFMGRALVPDFVIGVVGAVFLVAGLAMLRGALGGGQVKTSALDGRVLRSEEDRGGIFQIWLFNAIYLGIIGVCDFAFLGGRQGAPIWVWLLLGFFTIFGVAYVGYAVLKTLEKIKYGGVEIWLDGPVVTGGRLSGRVKLPGAAHPAHAISAELKCLKVVWSRASNDNSLSKGETETWSRKANFAIAWSGDSGQAQIRFDIPADAAASDIPAGSKIEVDRSYCRWDLHIGASVPGIDLDRRFDLQVRKGAPAMAGAAAPVAAASARAPAASMPVTAAIGSPPKLPTWLPPTDASGVPERWRSPLKAIATVVGIGTFLWWFMIGDLVRDMTGKGRSSRNAWPAAVAGPFNLKPDGNEHAFAISASGVKAERHGEDVRIRAEQLRLAKLKKGDDVPYTEVGAYLILQPQGGQYRELARWRDGELRGTIAAGTAEAKLGPVEFEVKNAAASCVSGDCWVKFYAIAPSASRWENTDAVRFLFSPSSEIAARPAAPKFWDTYLERAMTAMNQGRDAEAQQAFDEALSMAARQLGEGSAAHARVLMHNAVMYERRSNREEEQKRLLAAETILERLDDATIVAQVGEQWGQSIPIQEIVPRRLGQQYFLQRRYDEALRYYRRADEVTRRMGARLSPYSALLKTAENQLGIGASQCQLGRYDEAGAALATAGRAAKEAERQMETRWVQLFKGLQPGQDRIHRPNYESEQREHRARLERIAAYEGRVRQRACT